MFLCEREDQFAKYAAEFIITHLTNAGYILSFAERAVYGHINIEPVPVIASLSIEEICATVATDEHMRMYESEMENEHTFKSRNHDPSYRTARIKCKYARMLKCPVADLNRDEVNGVPMRALFRALQNKTTMSAVRTIIHAKGRMTFEQAALEVFTIHYGCRIATDVAVDTLREEVDDAVVAKKDAEIREMEKHAADQNDVIVAKFRKMALSTFINRNTKMTQERKSDDAALLKLRESIMQSRELRTIMGHKSGSLRDSKVIFDRILRKLLAPDYDLTEKVERVQEGGERSRIRVYCIVKNIISQS